MNLDHLNIQKTVVGRDGFGYVRTPDAEKLTKEQWLDLHKVRRSVSRTIAQSIWDEREMRVLTRSYNTLGSTEHFFLTTSEGLGFEDVETHDTYSEAMEYHEEISKPIVDRIDYVLSHKVPAIHGGAL